MQSSIRQRVRFRLMLLAIAVLVFGASVAAAQDATPPPPPPGAPGDALMLHGPGPMEAMHGDIGEGKTVTGVPLTAEIVVSRDTNLADGNRIHKETHATLYRDSQGRLRREITLEIGTPTTGGVKHTMIMIKDPVSGHRYMLDPGNKTARELPIGGKGRGPRPEGPGGPGGAPPKKAMGSASVQEQQLGTKTIDGVQAVGTRVTRTIPAGEIGNEKPIEVVTERWFATDLQLPVLMTHSDPMMGTVTTKLTSVTRGEPDASLFQVPTDYKLVSGRPDEPFYVPLQP